MWAVLYKQIILE